MNGEVDRRNNSASFGPNDEKDIYPKQLEVVQELPSSG
jgi:hypothetical protein